MDNEGPIGKSAWHFPEKVAQNWAFFDDHIDPFLRKLTVALYTIEGSFLGPDLLMQQKYP